jgi:CBS domain-containing protein
VTTGMRMEVAQVMRRQFDLLEGKLTVAEALQQMRYPDTRALIIDRRDERDEYGIVLIADIAKKVLAADRSPDRVNLYEIMSKPVLGVPPGMDIRYCARLMERFGITLAPVLDGGKVLGIVGFHDLVLNGLLELIKHEQHR